MKLKIITAAFICFTVNTITAQEKKAAPTAEELAKKLANPIASLISVPFQNNTDYGIGQFNGSRNTLNFQPVVPIALSKNLNLIARVVLPIISQKDITANHTNQDGLGDAVMSAFFSPTGKNGFTWGAGPVFLIPTATNDFLGTKKLGVGPTALALKQTHGWTIGALVNQIWSVAGDDKRADVSQFFLQPFVTYNWKSGAGLGVSAEISQNWEANTTTAFIIPALSGVTKLGKQTVQLFFGPRIPVSAPKGAKSDFGFRGGVSFVFPK